jgi:lipid II:glycine glycyltransferase (peptidoglycan interpeptide bridge formation enzyme)
MASYLIQWEAILDAKIKGFKFYDFWGVDEKKWPGITRFKTGFGGKEVEYVGAWDYVFQPGWYWIYRIAKQMKF